MVKSTPSFTSESLAALKQRYADAGQDHVFKFFNDLDDDAAAAFFEQLSGIDIEQCNSFFDRTARKPESPSQQEPDVLEPLDSDAFASTLSSSSSSASPEELEAWREEGMRLIRANKVAVMLLAGGQGSRLGSSAPKGCYDIGLPSHKNLFTIQAERIRRLQQIAGEGTIIPWLVMTSGPTMAATKKAFADSDYFGLNADDIYFFNQGVLPCFDMDGKVILESP
ncbi:UDP-N-acetylglucosamine pyrophosphorylase, partial [Coemansia sp. RSA 2603]